MIQNVGNEANLDRMLNSPEVGSKKICKNGRLWNHNNCYHNPVHHIDLNKNNNAQRNLISLCRECHLKIHFENNRNGGDLYGRI
jgi:hypothetical protein